MDREVTARRDTACWTSFDTSLTSMDYEITPEEVKAKLDQGEEFTVLDVREPWEFEAAHLAGAKLVLTDSGGIQEETTVLDIPCLTLRENTDRPVTVTEGTSMVVGTSREKITAEAAKVINGNCKKGHIPKYWDGKAAARIVQCLLEHPPGK